MSMQKVSWLFLFLAACYQSVRADGIKIDKVYDPYVQPSERELEYRSNYFQWDEQADFSTHFIGFGYGVSDRWFAEVYAVGERLDGDSVALEAVELEAKWQITEQGEYGSDWGVLFELEDEHSADAFEFSTKLLAVKDIGRWTATTNLGFIYEWGGDIKEEVETTFAAQMRYRLHAKFEPGIEFYSGQNTRGLGPFVRGGLRLSGRKSLSWEGGIIFGLSDTTPDQTVRLVLEFEF